jgi:thiamine-monophosphate kinase
MHSSGSAAVSLSLVASATFYAWNGMSEGRNSQTRVAELDLLRQIRSRARNNAGVALGIGDDCALLRVRRGEEIAVTTDLSIDGRHFRVGWHPPEAIGHRTLARGLSDLAAMGARPLAAFISLGLPKNLVKATRGGRSWVSCFYDGLLALADAHKTPLAGGDLAESPLALADVVLVGAVPRGRALLRSAAKPGDAIYVTGALGGSAAGLEKLADLGGSPPKQLRIPDRYSELLRPHLYPQPRLAQGEWLRRRGIAAATIDLSDGLSTDLAHLCEESEVAAEVDSAAIPLGTGATLEQALHGGEDYELLFTARAGKRVPADVAGVAITRIGRVVRRQRNRPQIVLMSDRGARALETRGWQHFV